jgi:hypothetical protein
MIDAYRVTPMLSAATTSRYLRAFGRLAAVLVLALGLLSAAGAAHAMDRGFHGGGFHGGGFHGGGFHGGFHDRGFHHHRFHNDFFFFGGFGGCCWGPSWGWDPWWSWGPSWAGYYPYYPYYYPSYYYPSYYYYPPPASYYPPPAGVTQSQPNCQSGQWRQEDGSIISGTACLQPDGTWKMAY